MKKLTNLFGSFFLFASSLCFGAPNSMTTLDIQVEILEKEIHRQGSFLVQVVFTNTSKKSVMEIDENANLVFELKSEKQEIFLVYTHTPFEKTIHYVYGDFPQPDPLPVIKTALLPGENIKQDIDISRYYTQILPTGNYYLTVHYPLLNGTSILSKPVPVLIINRN